MRKYTQVYCPDKGQKMNMCTSYIVRHYAKYFYFFGLLGYLVFKQPCLYYIVKEIEGH